MTKPWSSLLDSLSLISYPDSEEDHFRREGMAEAIQESVDRALGSPFPDERPMPIETSDWKNQSHFARIVQAHH